VNEARLVTGKPTTIASWAFLVSRALDEAAIDSNRVFLNAGIDLSATKSPQDRIPVEKMATVWKQCVTLTKDPYFALRLAPLFQPSTYSALGMAVSTSKTFEDALKRCRKYHQLTSDAALLSLEITPDAVDIEFHIPEQNRPVADEAIEAFCITMMVLFRHMINPSLSPISVEFEHKKDISPEPYETFFHAPVSFSQPVTRLRFPADLLDRPVLFSNPQLAQVLDEWIENYLADASDDLLSTKVKAYIFKHLALGEMGQNDAAKFLCVSVRSLQRKLSEEGTTYSELLDDCRHSLALKYISRRNIPITEIAFLLGFSDQSNFSRSFKRWTGTTPQKYRSQVN
jgi:AraC-like DNA-binding protein